MTRLAAHEVRRVGAEGFALTLHEVAKAFKARMDEKLRPLGLSSATRRVVGALACSRGPLTQRELAEAISVEGPTLVRLLDRLEAMEWVTRETVAGDRRMKHVQLTAKAEPFLEEMIGAAKDIEKQILQGIPEQDVKTAHEVLLLLRGKLRDMAGANGGDVASPECG